jgi:hypothetical protein
LHKNPLKDIWTYPFTRSVEHQNCEELYDMYKDIPLSTCIWITRLKWAGHIIRMEDYCIPKKILGRNFGEKGK